MDTNEIVEGNRLIAEFMELKSFEDSRYGILWPDPLGSNESQFGLKYNTRWEWIMPVVEKICRIPLPGARLNGETHYPLTFGMIADNGQIMVRFTACPVLLADTLIEATWQAVVDFIRWYNSITPKVKGE